MLFPGPNEFLAQMLPSYVSVAQTIAGFEGSLPAENYSAVDPWCRSGLNALAIAARYPSSNVWAYDPDPTNIEYVLEVCNAASIDNLTIRRGSAHQALETPEVSRFDMVLLREFFCSSSRVEHQDLVRCLEKTVRPRGVVVTSYRTLNGWPDIKAVASLLRCVVAQEPNPRSAVDLTLGIIDELIEGGAFFFQARPAARAVLAQMKEFGAEDLVQRLVHTPCEPMSFGRVKALLQAASLTFIDRCLPSSPGETGSNPVLDRLLDDVESTELREAYRAVSAPNPLRIDIFRSGVRQLTPTQHVESLGAVKLIRNDQTGPALPSELEALPDPDFAALASQHLGAAPILLADLATAAKVPTDQLPAFARGLFETDFVRQHHEITPLETERCLALEDAVRDLATSQFPAVSLCPWLIP